MADLAALAFFVADEIDIVEIPVFLHEEFGEQRRHVPKMIGFVDDVIPLYNLPEFRSHFRLSKGQVEDVITTLGPVYQNPLNTKVPLKDIVLACLWTLANQESYRAVANRFNISKSSLMVHLHQFCVLINTHMVHHVTWPVGQTLHRSELGFARAGFPRTGLAVDGCHIPIRKPHRKNPLAYLNRKNFYSVILIGFCDSQRRFCHVSVGHPGSWHDARAFRHTAVAEALVEDPRSLMPEGLHIIGDSAFPLLPQLLKPYQDNGHLTDRQKNYNRKLNGARVVIEQAFGILKSKFRRLKYLQMDSIQKISSAVCACCILYNLSYDPGDQHPGIMNDEALDDDIYPPQPLNEQAVHYRDTICNSL
ncbi:uncharacterized protein LOC125746326 [Brienomyrus brachyistius]|uniref:uncharacterized protein LOC125746326 n=1 Tax=Brienomyrus brachyistius TaxID=42636 RepID=UPI0020B388F2|nr:uncharacterized protein LOC125746326 [Brienomyrus brachyistius]XP_048876161.1 uncharacterized protein LOC125746326 [Brienomyrus brachyistius]XP_048876162.1 uncharacterized protein LOC125746326 [Brienomyrus brachyistius]